VCVANSMKNDCPVCLEYLFDSVRRAAVLPCGHTVHADCLEVKPPPPPPQGPPKDLWSCHPPPLCGPVTHPHFVAGQGFKHVCNW